MSNSAIEKLLAGLGSILFGTHFAGGHDYIPISQNIKIREETRLYYLIRHNDSQRHRMKCVPLNIVQRNPL